MKVVVLGGGIVGLWTAEVLSARGVDVTVRMAADVSNTTSAAAVAVITPLFPGRRDDPAFQRSIEWYRTTLEKFLSLEGGRFVEEIPAYEFGVTTHGEDFLEKDFSVAKFADVGLEYERVAVDPPVAVQNYITETHKITFGVRFMTPLCNSAVFLPWLADSLRERGVSLVSAPVSSIDEVMTGDVDVIVNCLGFRSTDLFRDQHIWRVRGQSMFLPVKDNPGPHFGIAAGNHAVFSHRRGFYVGSYFIEGERQPRLTPGQAEHDLSLRFARESYPELCAIAGYEPPAMDFSAISRVNLGIRPFRVGGPRLESEIVKGIPVVHNYGHGAHGWTIGYGTALEASKIVEACGAGRPTAQSLHITGNR